MKNKTSRLKKSMAIIGEGETEQFYFQHLAQSCKSGEYISSLSYQAIPISIP